MRNIKIAQSLLDFNQFLIVCINQPSKYRQFFIIYNYLVQRRDFFYVWRIRPALCPFLPPPFRGELPKLAAKVA